ncbi:hypothetical protein AB0L59_30120 [Streptomyces sp. NPDC052109]|uniref:hypothetical protein n=1 Tax=Streptomyces sp. NPDC052109 TaxID=3155527 RepID=UPI003426EEF9
MTREQALSRAVDAANEARALAGKAKDAAYGRESTARTALYATASRAWSDAAQAYIGIAAELAVDEKPEA